MSGTLRVVSEDMGRGSRVSWGWFGLQEICGLQSSWFGQKEVV